MFTFFDVVAPDLLVVTNDQREILTKRNVGGAPALVIEILSPDSSARDKRRKRTLYERVGVREYWVVDPDNDCISVYRLEKPGRFRVPPSSLRPAGLLLSGTQPEKSGTCHRRPVPA